MSDPRMDEFQRDTRVTYDIILPVKDQHDRIIDWRIVGRIMTSSVESALAYARKEYGPACDVRKPPVPAVDMTLRDGTPYHLSGVDEHDWRL